MSKLYAILETGGKQYKVSPGETIRVEKVPESAGNPTWFDKILAVSDEAPSSAAIPISPAPP